MMVSTANTNRAHPGEEEAMTVLNASPSDRPATSRPQRGEAVDYYWRYIDRVSSEDVLSELATQRDEMRAFFRTISEDASHHRYAPDKWSIKQVVAHLIDCERLFVFRAFWFARCLDLPLPSFDQDVASRHDAAEERSWNSLAQEFDEVRAATLSFFRQLPAEAWLRRGVASGNEFSVRAFAFIAAGHVTHHAILLRERYLGPSPAA
jgi:uncharacterized damage-inducible protein DinB